MDPWHVPGLPTGANVDALAASAREERAKQRRDDELAAAAVPRSIGAFAPTDPVINFKDKKVRARGAPRTKSLKDDATSIATGDVVAWRIGDRDSARVFLIGVRDAAEVTIEDDSDTFRGSIVINFFAVLRDQAEPGAGAADVVTYAFSPPLTRKFAWESKSDLDDAPLDDLFAFPKAVDVGLGRKMALRFDTGNVDTLTTAQLVGKTSNIPGVGITGGLWALTGRLHRKKLGKRDVAMPDLRSDAGNVNAAVLVFKGLVEGAVSDGTKIDVLIGVYTNSVAGGGVEYTLESGQRLQAARTNPVFGASLTARYFWTLRRTPDGAYSLREAFNPGGVDTLRGKGMLENVSDAQEVWIPDGADRAALLAVGDGASAHAVVFGQPRQDKDLTPDRLVAWRIGSEGNRSYLIGTVVERGAGRDGNMMVSFWMHIGDEQEHGRVDIIYPFRKVVFADPGDALHTAPFAGGALPPALQGYDSDDVDDVLVLDFDSPDASPVSIPFTVLKAAWQKFTKKLRGVPIREAGLAAAAQAVTSGIFGLLGIAGPVDPRSLPKPDIDSTTTGDFIVRTGGFNVDGTAPDVSTSVFVEFGLAKVPSVEGSKSMYRDANKRLDAPRKWSTGGAGDDFAYNWRIKMTIRDEVATNFSEPQRPFGMLLLSEPGRKKQALGQKVKGSKADVARWRAVGLRASEADKTLPAKQIRLEDHEMRAIFPALAPGDAGTAEGAADAAAAAAASATSDEYSGAYSEGDEGEESDKESEAYSEGDEGDDSDEESGDDSEGDQGDENEFEWDSVPDGQPILDSVAARVDATVAAVNREINRGDDEDGDDATILAGLAKELGANADARELLFLLLLDFRTDGQRARAFIGATPGAPDGVGKAVEARMDPGRHVDVNAAAENLAATLAGMLKRIRPRGEAAGEREVMLKAVNGAVVIEDRAEYQDVADLLGAAVAWQFANLLSAQLATRQPKAAIAAYLTAVYGAAGAHRAWSDNNDDEETLLTVVYEPPLFVAETHGEEHDFTARHFDAASAKVDFPQNLSGVDKPKSAADMTNAFLGFLIDSESDALRGVYSETGAVAIARVLQHLVQDVYADNDNSFTSDRVRGIVAEYTRVTDARVHDPGTASTELLEESLLKARMNYNVKYDTVIAPAVTHAFDWGSNDTVQSKNPLIGVAVKFDGLDAPAVKKVVRENTALAEALEIDEDTDENEELSIRVITRVWNRLLRANANAAFDAGAGVDGPEGVQDLQEALYALTQHPVPVKDDDLFLATTGNDETRRLRMDVWTPAFAEDAVAGALAWGALQTAEDEGEEQYATKLVQAAVRDDIETAAVVGNLLPTLEAAVELAGAWAGASDVNSAVIADPAHPKTNELNAAISTAVASALIAVDGLGGVDGSVLTQLLTPRHLGNTGLAGPDRVPFVRDAGAASYLLMETGADDVDPDIVSVLVGDERDEDDEPSFPPPLVAAVRAFLHAQGEMGKRSVPVSGDRDHPNPWDARAPIRKMYDDVVAEIDVLESLLDAGALTRDDVTRGRDTIPGAITALNEEEKSADAREAAARATNLPVRVALNRLRTGFHAAVLAYANTRIIDVQALRSAPKQGGDIADARALLLRAERWEAAAGSVTSASFSPHALVVVSATLEFDVEERNTRLEDSKANAVDNHEETLSTLKRIAAEQEGKRDEAEARAENAPVDDSGAAWAESVANKSNEVSERWETLLLTFEATEAAKLATVTEQRASSIAETTERAAQIERAQAGLATTWNDALAEAAAQRDRDAGAIAQHEAEAQVALAANAAGRANAEAALARAKAETLGGDDVDSLQREVEAWDKRNDAFNELLVEMAAERENLKTHWDNEVDAIGFIVARAREVLERARASNKAANVALRDDNLDEARTEQDDADNALAALEDARDAAQRHLNAARVGGAGTEVRIALATTALAIARAAESAKRTNLARATAALREALEAASEAGAPGPAAVAAVVTATEEVAAAASAVADADAAASDAESEMGDAVAAAGDAGGDESSAESDLADAVDAVEAGDALAQSEAAAAAVAAAELDAAHDDLAEAGDAAQAAAIAAADALAAIVPIAPGPCNPTDGVIVDGTGRFDYGRAQRKGATGAKITVSIAFLPPVGEGDAARTDPRFIAMYGFTRNGMRTWSDGAYYVAWIKVEDTPNILADAYYAGKMRVKTFQSPRITLITRLRGRVRVTVNLEGVEKSAFVFPYNIERADAKPYRPFLRSESTDGVCTEIQWLTASHRSVNYAVNSIIVEIPRAVIEGALPGTP